MRRSVYWALAWPFYLALALLFVVLVALLGLDLLRFAYQRIGIAPGWLLLILVATIVGSFINIPVARLQNPIEEPVERSISFLGIRYVIPTPPRPSETSIAVNVGGAVIPTVLSIYLAVHDHLELLALIGVVIAAVVVRLVARPIRGVGIAVPILLPALMAVILASLLTIHYLAALAYIIGVMGVLIGADLSNLNKTRTLGASIVSIGGAGTFDGIFLTGLLAVLLASI
ncbi:DUF1614 domain-containing protein [Ferrimicrobium sp.]|uniref:DUF1614 domain-containing protein n=1 Tax=Ferrimicrobium sp. TaxID=2926050 RepID=UPI002630A688|nr:DUF1614 domain-containing protein [Ferrimicrobium sp.]